MEFYREGAGGEKNPQKNQPGGWELGWFIKTRKQSSFKFVSGAQTECRGAVWTGLQSNVVVGAEGGGA